MTNFNFLYKKSYLASSLALFAAVYLLNFCKISYQCSIIFLAIASFNSIITHFHGVRAALASAVASVALTMIMLFSFHYQLNGQVMHYLIPASLLSVLISCATGAMIYRSAAKSSAPEIANLQANLASSLVDSTIMSIFFLLHVSAAKAGNIFMKEIFFKFLVSLVISLGIRAFKLLGLKALGHIKQ
jgi:hypothetical protein